MWLSTGLKATYAATHGGYTPSALRRKQRKEKAERDKKIKHNQKMMKGAMNPKPQIQKKH
jgi:hypothetical protein